MNIKSPSETQRKSPSKTHKLIGINTGELNQICEKDLVDINPQEIKNILVVDDDNFVLDIIDKVLQRAKYNIQTSETPKEALEIITKDTDKKIDLVITDIIMPEMNGDELVSNIRKIRNDISILFISGNSYGIKIAQDDPFLEKPFSISDLLSTVKEIEINKFPKSSHIKTDTTPLPEENIEA